MANTKLTLNIRESIIDEAKAYAKAHNSSLSKIVEHYLSSLSEKKVPDTVISSWTQELTAVKKPTADFDHKKIHRSHMLDKYANK